MSKNKYKKPHLGKGLTEAKVVEQCDPNAETKIEELLTPPEAVEVVTLETDIQVPKIDEPEVIDIPIGIELPVEPPVSGGGAWG
jgi:hypothetical protein